MKLENYNCCRLQWHIACDTSELILRIWCHINSSGLSPTTTLAGIQCSSDQQRIRDVNELKQWKLSGWLTCNIHCSRQSSVKAPVNGVNVCVLCLYQWWTFSLLALTFRLYIYISANNCRYLQMWIKCENGLPYRRLHGRCHLQLLNSI